MTESGKQRKITEWRNSKIEQFSSILAQLVKSESTPFVYNKFFNLFQTIYHDSDIITIATDRLQW